MHLGFRSETLLFRAVIPLLLAPLLAGCPDRDTAQQPHDAVVVDTVPQGAPPPPVTDPATAPPPEEPAPAATPAPRAVQEPAPPAATAPAPTPPAAQAPPAAAPPPAPAGSGLPPGVTMQMVQEGHRIYHQQGICFSCHGAEGAGGPLGPSLNDQSWIHITGDYQEIVQIVRTGVPTPRQYPAPMPPMGNLSDPQLRAVAAYVFALSRGIGGIAPGE